MHKAVLLFFQGNCSISNITLDPKQVARADLASREPLQNDTDMYPLMRDVFVDGRTNTTTINISDINATSDHLFYEQAMSLSITIHQLIHQISSN